MAIGERINFFRRRNNLTMNALGQLLGFDKKGADVRIAQYENNSRKPKADLTPSSLWKTSTALPSIVSMTSPACIWINS